MDDPEPRRNLKLVIAYNGAAYHGWQRQAGGIDTVQERVETAASRVLGHRLSVRGASRTDAGVHARGQVANIITANMKLPLTGMRRAVNSRLPDDITVRSVTEADLDFHASLDAAGKTYCYRIHLSPWRPVQLVGRVWPYHRPLDVAGIRRAAARVVGEHDFAGFASSEEARESTVRRIFSCDVNETGDELRITVRGNGFLYKMVRNIVGTLVEIGRGRWEPDRINLILGAADRSMAGPAAPPGGLTLVCVHYLPSANR